MYTPVKLAVAPNQQDKLKQAIVNETPVSIKVELTPPTGSSNEHTLLLTRAQIARLDSARTVGKRSKMSIRFSKKQVKANLSHQGAFLGMLAGLAAKALPTLLTGVTTGLLSGAVEKAMGNGFYLHKSGQCVKIQPVKGNGLYISPHSRLSGIKGDGLYLKRGTNVYDGNGLLLGSNSPFKNIPILNLLL